MLPGGSWSPVGRLAAFTGSAAGGPELFAGPGATQLLVAHVDLALHGLNTVSFTIGFLPFLVQTELGQRSSWDSAPWQPGVWLRPLFMSVM